MDMLNFEDIITKIVSEIKQYYDDYENDKEKFIKSSIEEISDNSDSSYINDIYEVVIDDIEYFLDE